MKPASRSGSLIRSAVVTGLVVFGLALAWIVLIGPALLLLLSPR